MQQVPCRGWTARSIEHERHRRRDHRGSSRRVDARAAHQWRIVEAPQSEDPGMAWPVTYSDHLDLGDPRSAVGVCTLWSPRRQVTQALTAGSYAAVGNLYSRAGLSAL